MNAPYLKKQAHRRQLGLQAMASFETTGLITGVALVGALGFGALGGAFKRDISERSYGVARSGGAAAAAASPVPAPAPAPLSAQSGAWESAARAAKTGHAAADDAAHAAEVARRIALADDQAFVARVMRGDLGADYDTAKFAAARRRLNAASVGKREVTPAAARGKHALTAMDSDRLFFMLTHQDGIRRLGTRAWDGALDAFGRGELSFEKFTEAKAKALVDETEQSLLSLSQQQARLEHRLTLTGFRLMVNKATEGHSGLRILADQMDYPAVLIANAAGVADEAEVVRATKTLDALGASRLMEIKHHQFDLILSDRTGPIRVANDTVNGRFADVPMADFERSSEAIADSLIKHFRDNAVQEGAVSPPKPFGDDTPPHPRHGP